MNIVYCDLYQKKYGDEVSVMIDFKDTFPSEFFLNLRLLELEMIILSPCNWTTKNVILQWSLTGVKNGRTKKT